jgi:hypothetical protein
VVRFGVVDVFGAFYHDFSQTEWNTSDITQTIQLVPAPYDQLFQSNRIRVQWVAGTNSVQYRQRIRLRSQQHLVDIFTSTPSAKEYIENTATNGAGFYRIRAER